MGPPKYTVAEVLRTHVSWVSMIQRCAPKSGRKDRIFYADRGITVCERWRLSFEDFISDLGPRPEGMTLDRIDTNGHYEPGNCKWSTPLEQASNTRRAQKLVYKGECRTIAGWARYLGLERATIQYRLKTGCPLEQALQPDKARKSFVTGLAKGKKLDKEQVFEIVKRAEAGETAKSLAAEFNVTGAAISHIVRKFGITLKKGRPKL